MLQSLIESEIATSRGRQGRRMDMASLPWPDKLDLVDAPQGPRCDSLELLWISAAVNEMFHLHAQGREEDLVRTTRFGAWLDCVEAAVQEPDGHLTFATSGSTGVPKRCAHSLAHLATEVAYLADLFADRRRIVALTPPHHIYGCLFTAMLPARRDIAVLDATRLGAGALSLSLSAGDLVVTFPERWRWLARSLPAMPPDVAGVVSTAPCPPDLVSDLIAGGLAGMTAIYGSSETAGLAVRPWPETDYTLMPQWRFPAGFDPDHPALTHASGKVYPAMDRMVRTGARSFTLAGRCDGAVQVGGVNVDPAAVAALIESHPGVAAAAVRLMRPDEGSRLKAFVIPAGGPGAATFITDLAAWLRDRLPAPARPAAFTVGDELPRTSTGKPADWSCGDPAVSPASAWP